jgi:hypothetical protein
MSEWNGVKHKLQTCASDECNEMSEGRKSAERMILNLIAKWVYLTRILETNNSYLYHHE